MVVDMTNTDRYYGVDEWESLGVLHFKVPLPLFCLSSGRLGGRMDGWTIALAKMDRHGQDGRNARRIVRRMDGCPQQVARLWRQHLN
jgi:hypothetical protein